jgi:hypothetical protein
MSTHGSVCYLKVTNVQNDHHKHQWIIDKGIFLLRDGRDSFTTSSNEETFKFNSTINRHNCVFWVTKYRNVTEERAVNLRCISLWCCMTTRGMIGQFFFEANVTGTEYTIIMEDKNIFCTTALPHRCEKISRCSLSRKMDRTNRKYAVSIPISWLNVIRLLLVGHSKEHCVGHKTKNIAKSDTRNLISLCC